MPEALLKEAPALLMPPSHLERMYARTSPGSGEWARLSQANLLELLNLERRALTGIQSSSTEQGHPYTKNRIFQGQMTSRDHLSSISHRLFQAKFQLNVMISQIAMHLTPDVLSKLSDSINDLLEPEAWHEGDNILNPQSYFTFLRFLIFEKTLNLPSFGISHAGFLLGAWLVSSGRLIVEFLPNDQLKWALSRGSANRRERVAATVEICHFRETLAPFNITSWFTNGAQTPAGA